MLCNIDLPRFHSNQHHPHSKRHLCDRCVIVSKCTEDNRSKVCVFRSSKATGTTAKPFSSCRTGSQNRGIYFTLVCVQTFLLCAVLEVTLWRMSMKDHPSGEGAGAVFELCYLGFRANCYGNKLLFTYIKVRSSQTHPLCINLTVASRAHRRVFLL